MILTGEYDLICPTPQTYREVTITNVDSVYAGNDFAYYGNENGTSPCPVIEVSNVSSLHRVCCPNNRYIRICNNGSGPYFGYLQLNYMDNFIEPISATLPYTTNGNTLTFAIPSLGIGQCMEIVVTEQVTNPAFVNELACVEAVVTPVDPCFDNNSLWDGSNLIAIGQCQVDSVQFTVTNTGSGNMQQPEAYEVYNEGNLIDNGTVLLGAGQSQVFTYVATGNTLVMQVNQSDYNPNVINPSSFVSNCGPELPPSQAYNLFSQGDEPSYVDMDCETITNSYDPNDKAAVPVGLGVQHFISSNDEIQYKIRFQNLGNAPANKIVVVDSLDSYLDPITLQIGAASHDYTATLTGNGVLTFTFENIELPAASVDETNSIGVISYTIKQRWDNPINYTINNKAYIYFDLNPAIITNNVFHNIKENFATSVAETIGKNTLGVIVYPNPTAGNVTIALNSLPTGQQYSVAIYNSAGMLVKQLSNLTQIEATLDVSTLSSGLYTYRVVTGNGKSAAGRFIKE